MIVARPFFVMALFAAGAAPAWAQSISFLDVRRHILFSSAQQLLSSVTGDFNGDGVPDLVVSSPTTSWILLGEGGGKFQTPQSVPVGGVIPKAVDLNGDGKLDLVANTGNELAIALGNGDGTFRTPVLYPVQNSFSFAIADFNHDGRLDIAVGQIQASSIALFLGNGDGTFQNPITVNLPRQPYQLRTGDFNGDGRPDLAILGYESPFGIAVLFGNGDGTFLPPVDLGSTSLRSIDVADFNGDGRTDIIAGYDPAAGAFTLLYGQADGTFRTSSVPGGRFPSANGVQASDLNGDGKPDIVVTYGIAKISGYSAQPCGFGVLLNHGAGVFQQLPGPAIPGQFNGFAVADVNGDGRPDLVSLALSVSLLGDGNFNTVWFQGNGDGTFHNAARLPGVSPGLSDTVSADFNGDGKPDLVSVNATKGTISVRLGRGAGAFSLPVEFPAAAGNSLIAAGDFNGDGKLDIATSNGTVVAVLPGNGDGTFQPAVVSHIKTGVTELLAADFNGDGALDLAWVNVQAAGIVLGHGDGTFSGAESLGQHIVYNLAVADLNGDGKPDLVGVGDTTRNKRVALVWINTGADGLLEPDVFGVPGRYATSLALGDVNGDGKADLVMWCDNDLAVFLGNGEGQFVVPRFFGNFPAIASSLALVDLNGSGALDAVITSFVDSSVAIFQGAGDGTFLPAVHYPVGAGPVRAVAGFFSSTAKKDIVVPDIGSGELTFLQNSSQ